MKIGNPADKPPVAAPVGRDSATSQPSKAGAAGAAGATGVAGAAGAEASASAKIELSSTAASLLSGGTSSEFDADKVARLSQAIGNGTFKVDADAIADKLIANAQELLTKVKG